MSFFSFKKFIILVGLASLFFAFLFFKNTPVAVAQSCSISGSYGPVGWTPVVGPYSYSRTNGNVTIGFQGGANYQITTPLVNVIYRSTAVPGGFLTLLKEIATGDYYFLIGEDDFMPYGYSFYVPNNVETAFETDFIPTVSQNLIGGTINYSAVLRVVCGGCSWGYSIITAQNTPADGNEKIHFIFADWILSDFLNPKGWSYTDLGFSSGSLTSSLDICALSPLTCTLSVSPSSITSGDTATLSWWTTTNAASASIDQGIGSVTPVAAGNRTVTPSITTTYIMTVTGSGTATCQTTISVSQPPLVCTTGGLVPCGRSCDDLTTTDIDESKPCDLCAAFYMLKNIINFATELAIGIAIFILVIAGLLYVFSAGDPGKIELAKSAITYALTGLALVFAAWLVIAIILQGLGYADLNTWNQVNCTL